MIEPKRSPPHVAVTVRGRISDEMFARIEADLAAVNAELAAFDEDAGLELGPPHVCGEEHTQCPDCYRPGEHFDEPQEKTMSETKTRSAAEIESIAVAALVKMAQTSSTDGLNAAIVLLDYSAKMEAREAQKKFAAERAKEVEGLNRDAEARIATDAAKATL